MSVNFYDDNWVDSDKLSATKEICKLYEKKLGANIIQRIKIKNRKQQRAGYDIELHLDDGRILTIEEKFRKKFYPDLLLEIRHTNGNNQIGWLYKSEAEILAYFQPYKNGYNISLWKLKDLAQWSKSNEFIRLVEASAVKEIWSTTKRNGNNWHTQNYAISFRILRNKAFEYRNKKYEQNKKNLPIEFFKRRDY